MARVHFHPPPELKDAASSLPEGTPCTICLMVAKGAQLDYLRSSWEPVAADGNDDKQAWFTYDTGTPVDIREAVLTGISEMMPGLLVPVCWDHLGGIVVRKEPPRAPLMQANGALPPEAFRKGKPR